MLCGESINSIYDDVTCRDGSKLDVNAWKCRLAALCAIRICSRHRCGSPVVVVVMLAHRSILHRRSIEG